MPMWELTRDKSRIASLLHSSRRPCGLWPWPWPWPWPMIPVDDMRLTECGVRAVAGDFSDHGKCCIDDTRRFVGDWDSASGENALGLRLRLRLSRPPPLLPGMWLLFGSDGSEVCEEWECDDARLFSSAPGNDVTSNKLGEPYSRPSPGRCDRPWRCALRSASARRASNSCCRRASIFRSAFARALSANTCKTATDKQSVRGG